MIYYMEYSLNICYICRNMPSMIKVLVKKILYPQNNPDFHPNIVIIGQKADI